MAHFIFVISQNAKWRHAGFYIDCHRMTVPENILLQKNTVIPKLPTPPGLDDDPIWPDAAAVASRRLS